MSRLAAIVVATGLSLSSAGCAAPPRIEPGPPLESTRIRCRRTRSTRSACRSCPATGCSTASKSKAPLAFNIHYYEGKAGVMPVARGRVSSDEGTFVPLAAHDYCLMWEAGVEGTTIAYTLRLTRGRPK